MDRLVLFAGVPLGQGTARADGRGADRTPLGGSAASPGPRKPDRSNDGPHTGASSAILGIRFKLSSKPASPSHHLHSIVCLAAFRVEQERDATETERQ